MIGKIIYLSGSVFPSTAANSVHVMKMCQAFAKHVDAVELLARTYSSTLDVQQLYSCYGVTETFSLKLVKIPKFRGSSFLTVPAIWRYLSRKRAEHALVIARDHIGALVAARIGYWVIFESHGLPSSRYVRWIENELFRHANLLKLVVISDALNSLYRDNFDVLPDNIEVHHDAADTPEEDEPTELSASDDRPLRVGYIGHLYKGRGIEIILAAAAGLPEYEFHIYGGLSDDIVPYEQQSPPNAIFHGHIDPAKTPAARADCDILVMPYQENLTIAGRAVNTSAWMSPMKLFEYMSARRPIVSSDLPVLREVLNEQNAMLVAPENTAAWIDALCQLSDPSLRARLADQAYRDFKRKYTWGRRAEGILGNLRFLPD